MNGIPGCVYYSYGTCRVHNDPHYETYDKQVHHFMGLCTYTLSKLCTNSSLPYFNVEAKNVHRGNPSVSYVQRVIVDVYGYQIQIVNKENSRILVDELWKTLPVSLNGGAVKVEMSGRYVILETDFKLRVAYDTDHSVELKIPDAFSGEVCGMCGNYNNHRPDDFLMPDGQLAQNSNELGNSWIVYDKNDPSCTDQPPPPPPPTCPPEDESLYESNAFCGVLTSKDDLFSVCHDVVDPESFFESCVFDLCALDGGKDILCSALEAYADACQKQGVTIPSWRNITSCGHKECPSNSDYKECMTACPATCLDPQAPEKCTSPCVEGCECKDGHILSGGDCVSKSQCGCLYNDQYYNRGDEFIEGNCERRCQCQDNNMVSCLPMSCPEDEICKVQNGLLGCYQPRSATCHIYGDPHYSTFDGTLHHFQGSCNYTVSETCANTSHSFVVTARNEHRGNPSWTAINSVALTVDGVHIWIEKNNIVHVNNVLVTLPADVFGISIIRSGQYVEVNTNFGLQIKFNGDHELFVILSEKYKDKLCGLCGTYNDNRFDDFTTRNGSIVTDVNDFGNSWRVPDDGWPCDSTPPPPPTCLPSIEQEAEAKCEIIKLLNGPFAQCHALIPPYQYFESCVYDQCATGGDDTYFCSSLEFYAAACEAMGVILGDWRQEANCGEIKSTSPPKSTTTATAITTTTIGRDTVGTTTSTTPDKPTITPKPIVSTTQGECDIGCSFDSGFCNWKQSKSDNIDWIRWRGATPSELTGPSIDHTTGDGYYLYIDGEKSKYGDLARLESPADCFTGYQCLRFWYHMYGAAKYMELNVAVLRNDGIEYVTYLYGNHGDVWLLEEIYLPDSDIIQIFIEGRIGEDYRSDVAIDDISLTPGYCIKATTTTTTTTTTTAKTSTPTVTPYITTTSIIMDTGSTSQTTRMTIPATSTTTLSKTESIITEKPTTRVTIQDKTEDRTTIFSTDATVRLETDPTVLVSTRSTSKITVATSPRTSTSPLDISSVSAAHTSSKQTAVSTTDIPDISSEKPESIPTKPLITEDATPTIQASTTVFISETIRPSSLGTATDSTSKIATSPRTSTSPLDISSVSAAHTSSKQTAVSTTDIPDISSEKPESIPTKPLITEDATPTIQASTTVFISETIRTSSLGTATDSTSKIATLPKTTSRQTESVETTSVITEQTLIISDKTNPMVSSSAITGAPIISSTPRRTSTTTSDASTVSTSQITRTTESPETVTTTPNKITTTTKTATIATISETPSSITSPPFSKSTTSTILSSTNKDSISTASSSAAPTTSKTTIAGSTQTTLSTTPFIPPNSGNCEVSGDPHYYTFDNQVHHFMGTCTYTLSKLCKDEGNLTDFNVEAANENRGGNTKVSYVKYVNVYVYEYKITLEKNRVVKVNGQTVTLPIHLAPDVDVFISGSNVLVTTGFGLQVKFDGNHKVQVNIPGSYSGKVCGLCGNFNDNAADDFLNPDGVLEPDSNSLGNSWQVDNDTSCTPGVDHPSSCTDEEKETIASNSFCGIITDKNGPFKDCHDVVNPLVYFDNCAYDLCETNLDGEILCDSLQSYAESCQSQNVTIGQWRNDTFCQPKCPPNSHFQHCGTACPATCVNPAAPDTCSLPCTESCICDAGYVLYGNKCVPEDKCGCWDDDKYYPVDSEFWTDDTCSTKCICPSAGSGLVCASDSCPDNQYCGISNGAPGCHYFTYGYCRVHNDPHYDTFDRLNHDFMGLCTYTLAKLCNSSSSPQYFNIEAKNEHRGDPTVSYVKYVLVEVYGQKVQLMKNENDRVLVNEIWTTLPVTLVEGAVTVKWTGKYVSLQTDFRLTVSYDLDTSVEVKLPSNYSGLTCGMCGNFNNRKQDDYMMPNGLQAENSEQLGHSWIVEDDDPLCSPDDPEPSPPPSCTPEDDELYRSDAFCGLLISKDGPFHICNSVIGPGGFMESCLFDMCALNGDPETLCSLLAAYADACQKEGISISWRNNTFCPPECPENSHFTTCASACPATCVDPYPTGNCSLPCSEGCVCDPGYVISGGTCVPESHCGCLYNDVYYKEGEQFVQGNCESQCTCLGNNTVSCSPMSCAEDEICKVQDGLLGCYQPSTAICHIYGDPHYTTFDGTVHHFQGACTYTVVETCANTSRNFSVTTRNEHRGNPSWTAINSVTLTVDGIEIHIGKNNIVQVNKVLVTLPANVSGIIITQNGPYVTVSTDFGLELQFNGDHELFVRVKEFYKDALCGLCGTYNDNHRDDFMKPDGMIVTNVNEFGNSWRVPDDGWPCESTPPPPVVCPPAILQEAQLKCWILRQSDGPFKPCHGVLRPNHYFESCIFDQCVTGGDDDLICSVLAAYAAACEALGVDLGDWINNTICDPNRPSTTPALPPTSPPHTSFISASQPPITSTKDPGPTTLFPPTEHTVEITVPQTPATTIKQSSSGSTTLFPPTEHTVEITVPQTPGTTIPQSSSGSTQTTFSTTPFVPPDSGNCEVSGDPHYYTFDNQVHNFMGTCTYTLSKLCKDEGNLTDFNVEAANENRGGNTKVSYVKYVNVYVYEYKITLEKNRVVKVNGQTVTLPIHLAPDVDVFISGSNVLVTTGFGLQVKFDGNHKVQVNIPGSYSGKVCGLCGNFNGNAADDFLNPDGALEPDSNSLGNSWQVDNDTSCTPGVDHPSSCTDEEKETIASNSFCGIITDKNGPFKDCHDVINPLVYFDNCAYDLCETNLDGEILCDSLQSYAESCQSQNVTIGQWRNDTFCQPKCPPNSHFQHCGTACPATCVNPAAPDTCSLPCTESCICDAGYVLYGNKCVPEDKCGCWDDDKHYPVDSEFWTDDTCSTKCRCPSAGSGLVCASDSCPDNQYCGISNGAPGCHYFTYGYCRVHNDPHYDTFDRLNHNFMGLCTYTLAKLCNSSSSPQYFNIEAKNEHRGDPTVSYVKYVLVEVYGQKVQMVKNEKDRVLVNEIWTTLPVTLVEGAVTVKWTGKYVSLQTDFRLTVSYDIDTSVEVKLPSNYSGLTCGMCGNFNNRKQDDYMMPNGLQAENSEQLGHSWIVEDDDPLCSPDDPEPSPPPSCTTEDEELYRSDAFCGLLISKDGPFHICNSVIGPGGFMESCLFDMCALNGDPETLCSLLAAYADACQKEGISISWRNGTFCPPECPENSHFTTCASACPATCVDPYPTGNCSLPCSEGCVCDPGYVISGGTCVPESHCGCLYNDVYYKEGEQFVQGNCENQCTCLGNNTVSCSPMSCAEDEICKVQDGLLGCYQPSTAICHIYGDPHYSTFDGTVHHFQGACTYTVVQTCANTSRNFTVTTRNEHRGNPSWTAINSVTLTVDGIEIHIGKNNIVQVNKVLVTLPANVSGIIITQNGPYVTVSTDFGLEVQFNGDHELFVRVKEYYKDALCGLCGTYNDNHQDDFMKPNGMIVTNVNEFGNSWRVSDDGWPCESTPPPPVVCPPAILQEAQLKCWILRQSDGPFKPCHGVLRPNHYFESCIFDQCVTGGDDDLICSVLAAYAAACEALGVDLGDWINNTICDPNKPSTTPAIPPTSPPHTSFISASQPPLTSTKDPGPTISTTSTTTTPFVPPESGNCEVSGDPHYYTYDNQVHHFMGTCTYTLSKLCEDDGNLTNFNVEAANEHRGGNTRVSYVKYVNVDVHGYRITVEKNRVVKVDGQIATLPISLSPDINVFISGSNVLVTTGFGLQVKFDGNHKVQVTIPGNYSGKVCGLCGNFNGNAADDFLNPDGVLEPDSNSLGNSWQADNDTRCTPGVDHPSSCTDEEKETIASNSFCGLITDKNGPFKDCHDVVNPLVYFDNCVYDLCETNMDGEVLCDSLQAYAESCQSQNVTIGQWRNDTFCQPNCPPNSHFQHCGTACPATCVNPAAPDTCSLPCTESCICDAGYVLYGNKCVPEDKCGCWDDDKYYPVDSEFWTDDTCSTKCRCPSAGSGLVCASDSCPDNQYCGISNGAPGCHYFTYGYCRVHNDPHYDTFDRLNHNFMGLCTYTLAKLCNSSSSPQYFNIEAKNEHRGDPTVSYVKHVLVEVYGQKVQIMKNENDRVLVNEIWTTLPVTLVGGAVTVKWTGKYVSLQADFKLTVSYDLDTSVEVKLPSNYSGLTCGMCGNFNNRKQDDYMMPNGLQAENSEQLGHSWIVEDDDPLCSPDDPEPSPPPSCTTEDDELYRSDAFCGLLISKDGPFHICNSVIGPGGFMESCLFDMCALNGDPETLCSLLAAYADACQKEGISISWRNSTFCPPECPDNSHFTTCASACPATCVDPYPTGNCSLSCSEGCVCDPGYVISGGTCVPESHCGCLYNDVYYKEGEQFIQGNCETQCTCLGNNTVSCSPMSCAEDEICKVQDGLLGCYQPSTAICHIYGDPHYTTFDGTVHHFQGACTYTVVQTCANTSRNFSVTTRNEHRGNPSWTAINSVTLTVDGIEIYIGKNNIVEVNDIPVILPANVSGIIITQNGHYVTVSTDFGLELQFNGDHELFVRVKEYYKDALCGLCGTYNDNRFDDFMTPDGSIVTHVNDFGNSWQVPDDGWICDSTPPPPLVCPPSIQQEAEEKCWIIRQINGPFKPCHAVIRPHQYYESCVFDQCVTGGSDDLVCSVLQAYATACEALGVLLGDWISNTICDPNKPSPTPPAASTSVTHPHTDSTIALTTLRSTTTTTVTTPVIITFSICSASGDPHYNTFDGKVHHYMGNCSYTLTKLCNVTPSEFPYFHVYATNEHRGSNTKVSYIQSVHVKVYNTDFTLLKNKKLNVDGERTNLPAALDSRVKVHISGSYIILATDFGLQVKFDGNHYTDVSLPSTIKGDVCGLCGNYNGIEADDNLKPDGNPTSDSKDLGDSWLVDQNNNECGSQDLEDCDVNLKAEYSKNTLCGIITDTSGIFKDCHALVNPDNFFNNCVLDMCFTGGESNSLCYAVQAYAQQCSDAGECVEWRSDTFCPISCPARSYYKSCGTTCPVTCFNSPPVAPCKAEAVEGCFCNDSYVLSGDRCVSSSECGCTDENNNSYQLGESWFTHENCTQRCTCNNNNNITCENWQCGVYEQCKRQEGVLGCQSSGIGTCHIFGDPHFNTFDKVMHSFMGTCTYFLVDICDKSSVIPFTIKGKTEDRGKRAATYLKEVYIDIYGLHITLQKDRKILVDNTRIQTPWSGNVKGLTIGNVGLYTVVTTDFGMFVKFDGNHHLEVVLPNAYYDKVCGMCGNFNGLKNDELLMPNGLQAANVVQFGNSWKSEIDSDLNCLDDTRDDLDPPCNALSLPNIQRQCNVLQSDTFQACHNLVDPDDFIKSCVYDMCIYNGMQSTLCAVVQAYVDACRTQGVNIKWRNPSFCPLACPTHSRYTDCASLCPPTCTNIYAEDTCEKPTTCMEGCVCNDGYVLSGDQCVSLNSCGCRDSDDNYYNVYESWITPQCTMKCECKKGNNIQCKEYRCSNGVCSVNKNGKYYCKPKSYGKCTIAGDPHYNTFDGLNHHFQGKQTYIVSRTYPSLPDYLETFKIEGKNEAMVIFSKYSLLKELEIVVYNQVITFKQNKVLVLNGVRTSPPVSPHEGINIYQRPTRIHLETDFGLSISFDGRENAEIVVPSTYKDMVQGLCGNYDGNRNNDFADPNGRVLSNVESFGESWNVKSLKTRFRRDLVAVQEEDIILNTGDNFACSSSGLTFVNGSSFCGIMREENGPFKNCLPYISPEDFIVDCIFDTCAEFQSKELLCNNLEQYAIACQQNETIVDGWRQATSCGMTCDSNSVYSDRMSACPATCSNMASESECEVPSCEGCQCKEGYILSNYECVPYSDCGCSYLNKYHKKGESFVTDDCSQNCTCLDTLSVSCDTMECGPGEECTTASQIRGCYIPSPCLENPCENGGTCVELPVEGNSTSGMSCQCPSTHTGMYCEDEKEENTVIMYIVIGVIVGVFVICIVFMVIAYFYLKSKKKKNGFLDSSVSSTGDGRLSGSFRSINMEYNEPQVQLNLAFDENFQTRDNVHVIGENKESGSQTNLGFEDDDAVNGYVNETDEVTVF
ncbi:IgGFc-binding protein-like isoform X6 [Ranitomeya variabilis]|uniref:IgGFc-binding protein-like isoform X6 n=1 Tax=Ranitomeya variabilis TaxID=490064 RepID=UPI00405620AA